jgi:hypothetical protein
LFKEEFVQTHKEEEPTESIKLEQGAVVEKLIGTEETVAAVESVIDQQ